MPDLADIKPNEYLIGANICAKCGGGITRIKQYKNKIKHYQLDHWHIIDPYAPDLIRIYYGHKSLDGDITIYDTSKFGAIYAWNTRYGVQDSTYKHIIIVFIQFLANIVQKLAKLIRKQ